MYFTWLINCIISILFTLLTVIIAPILPLFATKDNKLPSWLSWAGTYDNDMDGDRTDWTTLPIGSYWRRVLWIWRNPAYGFEISVLGATITSQCNLSWEGNINIKNRDDAVAGKYFITLIDSDDDVYWNYRFIKPVFLDRCIMIELGWKLQKYAQHGLPAPDAPDKAQLVFSIRLPVFYPANPA